MDNSARRILRENEEKIDEQKMIVSVLKNEKFFQDLIYELNQARGSIIIETYKWEAIHKRKSAAPRRIYEAILQAHARGINTSILIYQGRTHHTTPKANIKTITELRKAGIKTWTTPQDRIYHSKIIIIDHYISYVGSHNLSRASLEENDETTIKIFSSEIAKLLTIAHEQKEKIAPPAVIN